MGIIWETHIVVVGLNPDDFMKNLHEFVDTFVERFAADYYKANP